jgi:hypothetical protein
MVEGHARNCVCCCLCQVPEAFGFDFWMAFVLSEEVAIERQQMSL